MWKRHPIFSVYCGISFVLFIGTVIWWQWASTLHTIDEGTFAIADDLYVISPGQVFAVSNQIDCGFGSEPVYLKSEERWEIPGIIFRQWRAPDGSLIWILYVLVLYPLVITSRPLPLWFVKMLALRKAAMIGLCKGCGYDLRASGGDCPECGTKREE